MSASPFHDVLEEGRTLASQGKFSEALKLTDSAIADARLEGQTRWVKILSQHAGILSKCLGDIELSAKYYRDAVDCDPEDAIAQYSLADALLRQGKPDQAIEHAAKANSLTPYTGMFERELTELMSRRWPELAK